MADRNLGVPGEQVWVLTSAVGRKTTEWYKEDLAYIAHAAFVARKSA